MRVLMFGYAVIALLPLERVTLKIRGATAASLSRWLFRSAVGAAVCCLVAYLLLGS